MLVNDHPYWEDRDNLNMPVPLLDYVCSGCLCTWDNMHAQCTSHVSPTLYKKLTSFSWSQEKYNISVCFSGLPWAWRCTSCTSFSANSLLSRPVLTRSLWAISSRFIRRRPNHIQFIKLCSRNRWTFFNIGFLICCSNFQEEIQEIQDSPPVLRQLWLQSFANSTQVSGLVSPSFTEKLKHVFPLYSPTNGSSNEEWARLVSLSPGERASSQVFNILINWSLVMWNWQADVVVLQMGNTQIITVIIALMIAGHWHSITTTLSLCGGTTAFLRRSGSCCLGWLLRPRWTWRNCCSIFTSRTVWEGCYSASHDLIATK